MNRLPRPMIEAVDPRRRLRAFTLVEVMIVVLVVAILASLVVPSLASATAPLPRTIGDVLDADFRRARIEAVANVREMHVVVGADRDRWWIQPAGAARTAAALPSSLRILGTGNLASFDGLRIAPIVNGSPAARGAVAFAAFTAEGLRTNSRLEIELIAPAAEQPLARWRVEPQRSSLNDIVQDD